jgi:hypothetical protein
MQRNQRNLNFPSFFFSNKTTGPQLHTKLKFKILSFSLSIYFLSNQTENKNKSRTEIKEKTVPGIRQFCRIDRKHGGAVAP